MSDMKNIFMIMSAHGKREHAENAHLSWTVYLRNSVAASVCWKCWRSPLRQPLRAYGRLLFSARGRVRKCEPTEIRIALFRTNLWRDELHQKSERWPLEAMLTKAEIVRPNPPYAYLNGLQESLYLIKFMDSLVMHILIRQSMGPLIGTYLAISDPERWSWYSSLPNRKHPWSWEVPFWR